MPDPINSGETWAVIRGKFNGLVADVAAAVTALAGKLTASSNLSDLPNKAAARTALELGSMAQQNAGAVAITGGTISGLSAPLPVASGGTGGNDQDTALTALGGSSIGKALFAAASQGTARSAIGAPATVDVLLKSGNFSGLADVDVALGNLGFSAFVRGLRAAADQAALRTALGLGGLAVKSDVAFADLIAAAVRLSSEGLASPTDTELATAAWAKAYADSLNAWQYAWHPYNRTSLAGTETGLFYNGATVASLETPDFEDGFEYRLLLGSMSHDSGTNQNLRIELYREADGSYGSLLTFSPSVTASQLVNADLNLLTVRNAQAPHYVSGQSTQQTLGAPTVTSVNAACVQSSQKRTRARISWSSGNIDGGLGWLIRRRITR